MLSLKINNDKCQNQLVYDFQNKESQIQEFKDEIKLIQEQKVRKQKALSI